MAYGLSSRECSNVSTTSLMSGTKGNWVVCVPAESAITAGVGSIVDVVSTAAVGGGICIAETKNNDTLGTLVYFGYTGVLGLVFKRFNH